MRNITNTNRDYKHGEHTVPESLQPFAATVSAILTTIVFSDNHNVYVVSLRATVQV